MEETFPDSSPGDILRDLEEGIRGAFPAPPEVNTEVKYVQESMEEYLSPAFYMIPAIDNTFNKVKIYKFHLFVEIGILTLIDVGNLNKFRP